MAKPTCVWKFLGLALLVLACGAPASMSVAAASGEAPELHRRILWMDKEAKQPMFIPEVVLNEKSLDELPLASADRDSLRDAVEERPRRIAEQNKKFPTLKAPLCGRAHLEWGEAGSHPPLDFDALMAKNEVTILGEVVAAVPGWSVWGGGVETVAYVKVQEVLRDEREQLRPGGIMAFRQRHGVMTVRGQKVCSEGPPGYYSVAKGDQVVVIGQRWQADPQLFYLEVVVPVEAGFASSQGVTPIEKTRPIALEQLRGSAKALEGRRAPRVVSSGKSAP